MPQITLPWPPAQLFPNYRNSHHWSKSHKQAKAARTLAWGLTAQELGPKLRQWPQGPVAISLRITPPKRAGRPADEDGVIGACKYYLDGISSALGVDDRHFRSEKPEWLSREGDGEIEISF
jgi:hypothetical protein